MSEVSRLGGGGRGSDGHIQLVMLRVVWRKKSARAHPVKSLESTVKGFKAGRTRYSTVRDASWASRSISKC